MCKDSDRVPRVEKNDAKTGKVPHVPCHDVQIVLKGCCGDHAICCVQRRSFQLALTIQHAPAIRDGVRNGQDASVKPGQQVIFQPPLQLGAPSACREDDKSTPQFADRYNAQIE